MLFGFREAQFWSYGELLVVSHKASSLFPKDYIGAVSYSNLRRETQYMPVKGNLQAHCRCCSHGIFNVFLGVAGNIQRQLPHEL